jgi:outer membrane receptor protein involved in Fe transport
MGFRSALFLTASGVGLLGLVTPGAAIAQTQPTNPPQSATTLGEVVVTASRREETVEKLPFTISAYSGGELQKANVTSVADLTREVPNFNIQDQGPRTAHGAIPIIRGLNASAPVSAARYFQSPVGFYLGNAPLTDAFPLFDLQRVEVLRGPQGTLYGAGSLSGAVRIVPKDPRLGQYEGFATAWAATLSHSSDTTYGAQGALNIPLGDTAAFRINARHEYQAGFIDYRDVLKRQNNNYLNGTPVLANPADVANSPGVYFDDPDGNWSKETSWRAAFRWEPTNKFNLQLAYNYAFSNGYGSNIDNNSFQGGPSPLDPRRILRPTGEYERSIPTLEPWKRQTQLATLDASYDLGFATLATTVAYGKTKGDLVNDSTVSLLGTPYGVYYTGVPANPRTIIPVGNSDEEATYTEEVRLVSKTGGAFDYVAGAFFEQQRRFIGLYVYTPGGAEQSAAANGGSTLPIALGGTYILTDPDGLSYGQETRQRFKDYSVYGDLTWHVTDRWQVTGGARFFHQTFQQKIDADSTFFFFTINDLTGTQTNDHIFKVNTSYQLDEKNQIYATISQGFRRGGANAFALEGPVAEPRALLTYVPDKTTNYEVGLKGTIRGIYYAADVFYIDWDKPQIDTFTSINLAPVVVNANKATSKGFEFELSGPIGPEGVSFNLGLAYAKARLTEDFSLPVGNGVGGVVENGITGTKGDRLPGAPDWSGAFNLNYETEAGGLGTATFNVGMDFRSKQDTAVNTAQVVSPQGIPAFALWHANVALDHRDWRFELYGTNLFDTRARLTASNRTATSISRTGTWGNSYAVTQPREIGVRVTRQW